MVRDLTSSGVPTLSALIPDSLEIPPNIKRTVCYSGNPIKTVRVIVVRWTSEQERAAKEKYKDWHPYLRQFFLRKYTIKPTDIYKLDIPEFRKPD
jgi:hypothetical protein